MGGLFLSGLEKAIIVNIVADCGLVAANKDEAKHMGGTGVGGERSRLSNLILNVALTI